ncbi:MULTISPECIES: hypothetical protein [Bacillota]|jgi:hypothetical protein|uniref:Flavodoxin domain-containing protein n=2 Tax=Amedibacillus TaxID=2749846 RepID=A0A7G9GKL0_9FIRM|nr:MULTISPECIES: hypothetical protein [Bacillota]QNM11342.1 hypothetical protein H9Q80_13900 [[Eubacterium] hominis]MCH4284649.1 hypothetical protein [Amedibacillus hominis]RGB54809.1 hypothetical protein DW271_10655 [Absiella sp. AM22-9]RGB60319.1 hypothetical protein DW120_08980 [Absiella sp. AM10-20]RGB68187.1 hypothetical protein DW113_05315 [Absiella sp. AM09-45]
MKLLLQIWVIICVSSGIFQTIPKQEPRHLEITRTNINHDKKILVLYHDEIKRLHILTERINQKMDISLYDIDHAQVPDADNFDLILLGDIAHQDDTSESMKQFLSWYDFKGKQVSSYYLDAMHQDVYEDHLKQQIHDGIYLHGLGINDDELETMEEVNHLMNGWLTSTYSPVSQIKH